MIITADYHTHTNYSHGKGTPEENVLVAIEKGLRRIAISEHAGAHLFYGVRGGRLLRLRREVDALAKRYANEIEVLFGLECNLIAAGRCDAPRPGADIPQGADLAPFDVLLLGYHKGVWPADRVTRGAFAESFGFGHADPVKWLQSSDWLMPVMIVVALWSSMGVGFLSILSGIINIDKEIYEAAYVDGMKNRWQEIFYITIPSIKPQMLFGAVMAIVNTFQTSGVGVALAGSNPTPNYAGQLIGTHIEDFGFIRNEMGYAAAVSVITLLFIRLMSSGANKLFAEKD